MKKRIKKADGGMTTSGGYTRGDEGGMTATALRSRGETEGGRGDMSKARGRNSPGFMPPGLRKKLPEQANARATEARSAAAGRFAPSTGTVTPGGSGGSAPITTMPVKPLPAPMKKGGAVKKRIKRADGGMAYGQPQPVGGMNAGGQQLPQQAMQNAQGKPFQPGGKFAPPPPPPPRPIGMSQIGAFGGGNASFQPQPYTGQAMYQSTPQTQQAAFKKGGAVKKAKGGMTEGSAKDTREDKAMAKKRGMSMAKWERSAADVEHDMPMKKRGGGIAQRGKGVALRGGGIATRGMGIALKKGGSAKKR